MLDSNDTSPFNSYEICKIILHLIKTVSLLHENKIGHGNIRLSNIHKFNNNKFKIMYVGCNV